MRTWRDPDGETKEAPMEEQDSLYLQVRVLILWAGKMPCSLQYPEELGALPVWQRRAHWAGPSLASTTYDAH